MHFVFFRVLRFSWCPVGGEQLMHGPHLRLQISSSRACTYIYAALPEPQPYHLFARKSSFVNESLGVINACHLHSITETISWHIRLEVRAGESMSSKKRGACVATAAAAGSRSFLSFSQTRNINIVDVASTISIPLIYCPLLSIVLSGRFSLRVQTFKKHVLQPF